MIKSPFSVILKNIIPSKLELLDNIRACVFSILVAFIPYKYCINYVDNSLLTTVSVILVFIITPVIYFLLFNTQIYFIHRLLIWIISRLYKAKKLFYPLSLVVVIITLANFMYNGFYSTFYHSLSNNSLLWCIILALSVIVGACIGIIISSNNLSKLWVNGLLYSVMIVLFTSEYLLIIFVLYQPQLKYSIINTSLMVSSLTVFSLNFIIRHRITVLENIEMNIWDLQTLRVNDRLPTLYKWIRKGNIWGPTILLKINKLLNNYYYKLSEKNKCKIRCRILFRRRKFDRVLKEAKSFLNKGNNSDVLTSLIGLSLIELGRREEAMDHILKAHNSILRERPRKPSAYFPFYLGYLFWQEKKIAEAIRYNEMALSIDPECPMALRNKALYISEIARNEYITNNSMIDAKLLLNNALRVIQKADSSTDDYSFASIKGTEAYIYLLLKDFDKAKEILEKTAAFDIPSRIFLAILHMRKTEIYKTSQCYIRKALYMTHKNKWNMNYQFASHLLDIIVKSVGKYSYNDDIVYYYDQSISEIVSKCLISDSQKPKIGRSNHFKPKELVYYFKDSAFLPKVLRKPI